MNEVGCESPVGRDFTDALIDIAGLNPHGEPVLRCVSGETACRWLNGGQVLRYGEPYLYIERWRSPQFLAQTGRFQVRFDPEDGQELLPPLPAEGHYDYFLRLECPDGRPHVADGQALMLIRAIWGYEHSTTKEEREEHLKSSREASSKLAQARRNDLWGFDPEEWALETTSAGTQRYVRRRKEI